MREIIIAVVTIVGTISVLWPIAAAARWVFETYGTLAGFAFCFTGLSIGLAIGVWTDVREGRYPLRRWPQEIWRGLRLLAPFGKRR